MEQGTIRSQGLSWNRENYCSDESSLPDDGKKVQVFIWDRPASTFFPIMKTGLHHRRFPEAYRISLGILDNRSKSNRGYLLHRHDDFPA